MKKRDLNNNNHSYKSKQTTNSSGRHSVKGSESKKSRKGEEILCDSSKNSRVSGRKREDDNEPGIDDLPTGRRLGE